MKRFLINCGTHWCGMDDTFRAEAESELDLEEIAQQLAYENFEQYDLWKDIAESEGYDLDEMTPEDWDDLYDNVDESTYYFYNIEPFEGDDEEWELYKDAFDY